MAHPRCPKADADGFYDLENAKKIAGYQACDVHRISDYVVEVAGYTKSATAVCIAPGRWEAHAILRACSEAFHHEWFDVDVRTARPLNLGGIDELKIARIVGAVGVRPYLVRKGKYTPSPTGLTLRSPEYDQAGAPLVMDDMIVRVPRGTDFVNGDGLYFPPAEPGRMTWPMLSLFIPTAIKPAKTWAAFRIMMALGLASGFDGDCDLKVAWDDSAYLPKPAPMTFDAEDEAALEAMEC